MSLRPSGSLTVAFALTFMVVGIVWANHLLAFAHFVRTDHVLVSLNLLELMSIAFLSVPTHLFSGKTSAIAAIHSMYIRSITARMKDDDGSYRVESFLAV